MTARFSKPGQWGHGIAEMRAGDHRWTGRVELDESKLLLPLRWRKPRCVFVNSTSDLFHERLPDEAIDKVFAVMALCPQHRFIVLTKRAERMRKYLTTPHSPGQFLTVDDAGIVSDTPHAHVSVHSAMCDLLPACPPAALNFAADWQDQLYPDGDGFLREWPLPNVILGVSVEDRSTLHRVDDLRATPAACRMVSFEPLLEDLGTLDLAGISWAVTGGESGPGARPMHPDWARSIRDQCQAAGGAFFFKQWGEWLSDRQSLAPYARATAEHWFADGEFAARVGKHRAGRLLDGREWTEFPEVGR